MFPSKMNSQLSLVPIIMAGGAGTRFWPCSTEERPKQFLSLFGARTLLQKSFDRISDLTSPDRILVLTNSKFVDYVKQQLPSIPEENIIGEPLRKDTAAAITIAALLAQKKFGNPILVILTSDHIIEPVDVFKKVILSAAKKAAEEDVIYTLGICPTYPATAYGYVEVGEKLLEDNEVSHFSVKGFKEKPDLATAERYIAQKNYFWNSGMFVSSVESLARQLQNFLPNHVKEIGTAISFYPSKEWAVELHRALHSIHAISIDYAVMEKAKNLRCVMSPFSWKDVGGWLALEEYLEKDTAANAYRGVLYTLESEHNLVFCEDTEETVALIGIKDLVIVRTGKCTLVAPRSRMEEIKKLVNSKIVK